jgi:hypothetical protein
MTDEDVNPAALPQLPLDLLRRIERNDPQASARRWRGVVRA